MGRESQVTALVQQVDALDRELDALRATPKEIAGNVVMIALMPTLLALGHAPLSICLGGGVLMAALKAGDLFLRRRKVRRLKDQRERLFVTNGAGYPEVGGSAR